MERLQQEMKREPTDDNIQTFERIVSGTRDMCLVKVTLLAQFFPPIVGGEERHVLNLGKRLAKRHDVTVITFGSRAAAVSRDGLDVRVVRPATASLPILYTTDRVYAPPVPDPLVSVAIARILDEVKPDVIHAHNWIVNSLVPLRRSLRSPLVLTLHDYSHVCATKRMMFMGELVCTGPTPSRCFRCTSNHYSGVVGPLTYVANRIGARGRDLAVDRYLAVSSAVARLNRLDRGPTPYQVIPNFIPDDLVDAHIDGPPDGLVSDGYIVFVGDLSRDKGIGTLLSAYERLSKERPPLLVIGRRTADSPSYFPPGVILSEPRSHDEVMRAFAHARFAVLPSAWHDPCPTVVLEAMACGKPVISTPMGGISDMVTDGREGLLVAPADPVALSGAIERLLADDGMRTRVGAAAKERAREFTASRVVPRIEEVYHEVVRGPLH
ncbi:glycosyltransferase family 4 protein [Frankia gtarii]|uniref:glycosyltransferase family 4 protein n=1 Tax=Frankia gtarii TaxID=2950102 RepID=UPI0021C19ADD|nr:glycosyltransferase family 4 protein [Frankia gtarii]